MVWFQCEECGENLKKPRLPNHFRICSAHKLSCIDCGEIFSKDSVQTHTQCMTEAEKYGPKDHGKPAQNSTCKPEKPKKNADVDITVGLSSHPPWFCSLCNTPTTSKQTLLLHADGKKHRAKAKAFLAAQKQCNQTEETKDTSVVDTEQVLEKKPEKKRKHDEDGSMHATSNACHVNNEEIIKAEEKEEKSPSKKNKNAGKLPNSECIVNHAGNGLALKKKIKWKKLIISTLKSKPDGAMKIKKLQKIVIKELKASGIAGDEVQLCDAVMEKISSSCRFVIDKKLICLAAKKDEKTLVQ